MKNVTKCILTADDRPHDKYTCNVCSALLSIRAVNVVDTVYHYFLSPPLQRSLPVPPSLLTVTNPSQPPQPPICSPVHSGTSRQRSNQAGDSNTQHIRCVSKKKTAAFILSNEPGC